MECVLSLGIDTLAGLCFLTKGSNRCKQYIFTYGMLTWTEYVCIVKRQMMFPLWNQMILCTQGNSETSKVNRVKKLGFLG